MHFSRIFNQQHRSNLHTIQIQDYDFIVGAYNIENVHWVAIIIDAKLHNVDVLDPKENHSTLSQKFLNSWLQYFKNRADIIDLKWENSKIQHPIQSDSYNCEVFVCYFIEQYVKANIINFNSSKSDLLKMRQHIAHTIESNKNI